jgi:hypothetical protein
VAAGLPRLLACPACWVVTHAVGCSFLKNVLLYQFMQIDMCDSIQYTLLSYKISYISQKSFLSATHTKLHSKGQCSSVGTGVSSPLMAQPQTRNPCPWEPATRVPMGQARTEVFLFPSAVFGEENPCPYGHLTEYVGVNGLAPVRKSVGAEHLGQGQSLGPYGIPLLNANWYQHRYVGWAR